MKIYVMRHGDALYRAPTDAERPLSEHGHAEVRLMARWLAEHEPTLRHVWHSPYLRAQQSMSDMCQVLPLVEQIKPEIAPGLIPMGDPVDIRDRVAVFSLECPGEPLLLVSHMPLVGELTAELVPGCEPPLFATAAIAEIDWQVETFSGQLVKLHHPGSLLNEFPHRAMA